MHEAINQAAPQQNQPLHYPILPPLLFPTENPFPVETIFAQANSMGRLNPRLNQQQMRAVAAIMVGSSGSAPYVVFGPPGT
jgi:hypothetical protein